jgi:hypothetical protein
MSRLILEPTPLAQWQALVHEAQTACHRQLDESLESYLVFLLMRFSDRPYCTARIMAEDFLKSQSLRGEQRAGQLREVGDHCLLFSGLFPQLAERRLVPVSYFVTLGRGSYQQLSAVLDRGWSSVYSHLSEAFVVLMDILHAMRGLGGETVLTPIQAMDLWQDTGSRRCYEQMCADGRLSLAPATPERH